MIKLSKFKKAFKSDDSRFVLFTGLKMMSVSLFMSLLIAFFFWIIISINIVFLDANGLQVDVVKQAYFDFIISTVLDYLPYFLVFLVIIFFVGMYSARMLLRPFQVIGEYCEEAIENQRATYNPDLFSDFKLLTRFSEYFFLYLMDARKNDELRSQVVPPQFTKVHRPVFDRVFFFHYILFTVVIAVLSALVINMASVEIHYKIIELSLKIFQDHREQVGAFLNNQRYIFVSIQYVTMGLIISTYFFLAVNLYSRVTGAAFGYFSTMRSFIKGNHFARVHLIGYNHVRPYSRSFNKYLDFIQRSFQDSEEKAPKG